VGYISSTLGTEVTPGEFPEQNGVAIQIYVTKTENALEVDLKQKVTGLALVSQILGTIAGITGAVAFGMMIFEMGETYLRQFLGEAPSKDDKTLSTYQRAWLDLVDYQEKERPAVLKRQAEDAYHKGLKQLQGVDTHEKLDKVDKDHPLWSDLPASSNKAQSPLIEKNKVASDDYDAPTVEKAVQYFTDAARFGHADAQYLLGLHLYHGHGCKRDIPEAIKQWEAASAQDHVKAAYELGMYYRKGGSKKDLKKSLRYLRDAAEKNHLDAMYWCGVALEHGEGDKVILQEAYFWYNKAARQAQDAKDVPAWTRADEAATRTREALRKQYPHEHNHESGPSPRGSTLRQHAPSIN